MSSAELNDSAELAPGARTFGLKRLWLPFAAVGIALVAIGVLWSIPPDQFERGMRVLLTAVALLVAGLVVLGWLFVLSGVSIKARVAVALVLLLAAAGLIGSVRRVEFTGDMLPTFDWRWQPERHAILEAHRAARPVAGVPGPADESFFEKHQLDPTDVPEYRGSARDGVVEGPPLSRDWQRDPPRLLWRQPVGGGYASLAVVGQFLFTIEQRREHEAVVAYDFDTGVERWVYEYPALFSETLGGDGPRATPSYFAGRVYALGATGILTCLHAATGEPIWSTNILNDNRVANLDWGMSGSPLIHDDKVIVTPGNQEGDADSGSVLAYDLQDGTLLWKAGDTKGSYASPMLATLGGEQQLLVFDAEGLIGYDPDTGERLWAFPWRTDFYINAAQPIVLPGDRIFISSQSGCALLKIGKFVDSWSAEAIWPDGRPNRQMKCSYANPVYRDGFVYGLDEGILACLDIETGQRRWKGGRYGHGQLLLTDDLLVVLSEQGELVLVEATPDEHRELGRFQAIEGKTWNNPVLVDGRIVVRNHLEMAVYDLRATRNSQ